MKPKVRLFWCGVLILGSAVYALLINWSPRVAAAIMLGYIGVVLTVLALVEFWKAPHE